MKFVPLFVLCLTGFGCCSSSCPRERYGYQREVVVVRTYTTTTSNPYNRGGINIYGGVSIGGGYGYNSNNYNYNQRAPRGPYIERPAPRPQGRRQSQNTIPESMLPQAPS